MKKLLITAIALVFSGCTSLVEHSNEDHFSEVLGTRTLTRDALLCKSNRRKVSSKITDEIVWQKDNESCYFGETSAKLKKGTEVTIFAVLEQKHRGIFHAESWYLVGKISGDEQEFYYFWGSSTTSPEAPEFIYEPKWQ
ncbi:hypothetical protein [Microbulbifer hydrolyticus]|uniref:Lipoprotein n=1 Tax=Microbulbifer hydrolyticus TaxID=48074 RepID=A0A6P1TA44_9GAMM|nr:hypothetical protein [Microbulbifer hydrolyticus]MBB5213333.1 hypothetical protein [Microbulbifer hydrolyticus]QHQ38486.1 hypothetical protein GTQ55_05420 [Microbulbifer hydrolyticus]